MGHSPTLFRFTPFSGYGSMTTVQVYVPGSRLSIASVGFSAKSPLLELFGSSQSIVDFVPPVTCEVTETSRSVSGVLLKLTVSPP